MNPALAILAFIGAALLDIVWVRYSRHAADGARFKAANFAALIILVGAFSWFTYKMSLWYTLPTAVGAWVGTAVGTKSRQAQ